MYFFIDYSFKAFGFTIIELLLVFIISYIIVKYFVIFGIKF